MLSSLVKKIPGKHQSSHSPPIITIIQKSIKHNIPYELMSRLNYTDLLYMIVEYEIDEVKTYLNRLEHERLNKQGVEVVEATPEMTAAFFRR